jgi:UDP-N-acetylglucosamine 2-epimerase
MKTRYLIVTDSKEVQKETLSLGRSVLVVGY